VSENNQFWHINIDTGGTFTDCIAISPEGNIYRAKVLSSGKLRGRILKKIDNHSFEISQNWPVKKDVFSGYTINIPSESATATIDKIRLRENRLELKDSINQPIEKDTGFEISSGEEAPILATRLVLEKQLKDQLPPLKLRLGTTKGTNALLERKGAKVLFLTTRGFKDIITISTQQRPDLFTLNIQKPEKFYTEVVEVNERLNARGENILSLTENELNLITDKIKKFAPEAIAIAFLHSYREQDHERCIANALFSAGFEHISISSDLSTSIKILPRAQTAVVNAYLAPLFAKYLSAIKEKIHRGSLRVMTSSGGLQTANQFQPKDSLLSGPAGGVVGASQIAEGLEFGKILTIDMGGTSTDVSRYDGQFDYQYETQVGDATLFNPCLHVETVAAGGGSICQFDGYKFSVGPESASANPGPACYGAGGPLTLTDVNLLLGRLETSDFGIPIDRDAAEKELEKLLQKTKGDQSKEEFLEGFLKIANEKMAEAIKKISTAKGYDPQDFALLAFGGAGGQHACKVAELLGIQQIIIPCDAGLLSAYGIGKAKLERFAEKQALQPLAEVEKDIAGYFDDLKQETFAKLKEDGIAREQIEIQLQKIYLRFIGQDHVIDLDYDKKMDIYQAFKEKYIDLFGHWVDREIEVESIKLIAAEKSEKPEPEHQSEETYQPEPQDEIKSFQNGNWETTPVFAIKELDPGATIMGPAIITSRTSTTFIDRGWELRLMPNKDGVLSFKKSPDGRITLHQPEEIALELFANRFTAIAEEMGFLLQRTAFSVNIKERMDFSCALLDAKGELIVNAPHIPVHLGSLGLCTRLLLREIDLGPGDIAITNHPGFGGSHLPDITLVAPVYVDNEQLIGYVANRAHHAELGGKSPGSMPADAGSLGEEGVVIPPLLLVQSGEVKWEKIRYILTDSKYPTRALDENLADINAAIAAIRLGTDLLKKLVDTHGQDQVMHYMDSLKDYAEASLNEKMEEIEFNKLKAEEQLDDGSRLCVSISKTNDKVLFDFSGSSECHPGNLNANPSIVTSAVLYVLRLLIDKPLPLNEGIMRKIVLSIPGGSILNPGFPEDPFQAPAVVGGNTETSQRLVDTLLKAFQLAACSQGTMNNLLFGNDKFGYYETIGGGTGAGEGFHGADGVHQHMTNTKITDPEILELRYPVRLEEFSFRQNSGGKGKWKGGNGLRRKLTFLETVEVTILSQHREVAPYGLCDGEPGKPGNQLILRADGSKESIGGIDGKKLNAGDALVIETPGGGGYG